MAIKKRAVKQSKLRAINDFPAKKNFQRLGFLMVYSVVYNSLSGPNRGPRTSTDWTAGPRAEKHD